MKKIFVILLFLMFSSVHMYGQVTYYQCDSAPDATMMATQTGIVLQLDGYEPMAFSPTGMNNQYMFYSCGNINVSFTIDLKYMVIFMNGQSYQYTMSGNGGMGQSAGEWPSSSSATENSNSAYYQSEIDQLEYKIRDAERSLCDYESSYDRNPTVTGGMLVREQQKLIQTYRDRISWLRSQL